MSLPMSVCHCASNSLSVFLSLCRFPLLSVFLSVPLSVSLCSAVYMRRRILSNERRYMYEDVSLSLSLSRLLFLSVSLALAFSRSLSSSLYFLFVLSVGLSFTLSLFLPYCLSRSLVFSPTKILTRWRLNSVR